MFFDRERLRQVPKKLKRLLRWVFIVAFILLGIALAGLLLIQTFISSFLQDYVRTELGWTLKIGSAEIQFHPLAIRLESIEVSADNEKPFLQAKSASARIPYSSFWQDEFLIQELTLNSPKVNLDKLTFREYTSEKTENKTKTFRIENATVQTGEAEFQSKHFSGINLKSQIDSEGIRIKQLQSRLNDMSLQAEGTLKNWNKPEMDISYEAEGDAAEIATVLPSIGKWKGPVFTKGSAKGDLSHPLIEGRVRSPTITFEESTPFNFDAQYKYDFENNLRPASVSINFESVPLQIVGSRLKQMPQFGSMGKGTLRYSGCTDIWKGEGDLSMSLEPKRDAKLPLSGEIYARFQSGSLQINQANLQLFSSTVIAEGTLSKDQLNLKTDFRSPRLKDIAFLYSKLAYMPGTYRVQAQLSGPYDRINVNGLLTGQTANSEIAVKGSTNIGTKAVALEFRGNANSGDLKVLLPDLQKGDFEFEGSLLGTWKKPALNATLNGTGLEFRKLRLNELSGRIETEGNLVQFHAESPDAQLQTDGSYQLNSRAYELKGKLNGPSAQTLLAFYGEESIPIRGNVYADFEASGNALHWKESSGILHMQMPEAQWKDIAFSVPRAEIQLERGNAQINASATSPNVQIDLTGDVSMQTDFPLDLEIRGKLAGGLIEKISSDWKGEGELALDVSVRGDTLHPRLVGKLLTENFNVNYLPNKSKVFFKRAEMILSEQKINFEGDGSLNDSAFLWSGNIPLVSSGDGEVHFEIADLPVRTFYQAANISGNLKIAGDLQGKGISLEQLKKPDSVKQVIQEWSGNISVSPANLKLGENDLTVDQPILISLENQGLLLPSTRIRSGDMLNLEASGNVNLQTGKVDSAAHLEAKIDFLSNLKADIQSSGPLTMDVRLSGTMENPEYQGTIQLTNASLRIPDSPFILENFSLLASLDNKRLRLDKLEGRSGGGVITGGGELIRGAKGSQVWLQGKNVAANYPEGLRSQMDFDLKLSAVESDYLLSGNVNVLRSFYEEELTLRNPIIRRLLATSRELTTEKELKNKLKFALNIQTVQDLRFKNSSAIVRAGADLKLGGSLYKPRLNGRLNVRPGSRIFLAGNQYDVEKASLEFFGSEVIEPNLDVTLSSLLRDFETDTYYEVNIPFGGTLSNIEFKNVRATPSLSRDQVFSLITDGTTSSDQVGSSGARFQRQLISFFAGQTLGAPSAAVAKTIGLSRIKIQQEGLSSVNDPKTRLMLGKDIGAGFSLIYSFVLNDPDEQTWIATYRYGRNIIGRFIDQDDDTYTVSVSHRIQFGKGVKPSYVSAQARKKERGLRIASIELKNESQLTEKQITDILKTEVGDDYDYWDFQDRVDKLKKELQKMEYLYPLVDVREKEIAKDSVALEVLVQPGERTKMIFEGYEVKDGLLKDYEKMWRSGISAIVVQQMIREDLLKEIQLDGYYKVSVNARVEKSSSYNVYHFEIKPGERFESVELIFRGAQQYPPETLQEDLEAFFRSSGELFREAIYKPSKFTEKIKLLYAQQGYLRAAVEPGAVEYQSGAHKIVEEVHIKEGSITVIEAVTVSEGESFPESLLEKLQVKEGEKFRPEALLDDELKIRDFYESSGNQDVSVRYNIEFSKENSNLVVQWNLQTGVVAKIASIRVEGNESTRTDLILKQINLKKGDVITRHNQSLAKKRLSDLGVFQQTVFEMEETDVPGLYDVVVRVVENKKYEFQYGGRYNTDDKAGAEIRLTDFNFLGRAQNLSLYTRSTLDIPLFRVDYTMPVTGSFWDHMRLSMFRDETDEDIRATVSGDLVKIPFTNKQLAFQFHQEHRFWNDYRLLWGVQFGSVTADFQDLATMIPLQFQGTATLLRSTFLADRRDDPLNATGGYFFSVDGEFAPTVFGTDISFIKNYSQLFYYKKLGKIISATGVRAGFLKLRSNILTISEKFRTGGSTTLRGFEHNTVIPGDDPISVFFGGDSVFILNQEIRFPIYKWISGAVFYDAGNVYLQVSDFDPSNLRHSGGFGFRAGAGGFVLRIDLGFNLHPEEDESHSVFHFAIGQAF